MTDRNIDWSFVDSMHQPEQHHEANYREHIKDLREALLDHEERMFNRRFHEDHEDDKPIRKLVAGCADCVERVKQDQEMASFDDCPIDDLTEAFFDDPFDGGGPLPWGRYHQALGAALMERKPGWFDPVTEPTMVPAEVVGLSLIRGSNA